MKKMFCFRIAESIIFAFREKCRNECRSPAAVIAALILAWVEGRFKL